MDIRFREILLLCKSLYLIKIFFLQIILFKVSDSISRRKVETVMVTFIFMKYYFGNGGHLGYCVPFLGTRYLCSKCSKCS